MEEIFIKVKGFEKYRLESPWNNPKELNSRARVSERREQSASRSLLEEKMACFYGTLIFYSSLFLSDNMKYEERELLHIILKIRFARHKGSGGNLMTDLPGPEIKESKQRRSANTRLCNPLVGWHTLIA